MIKSVSEKIKFGVISLTHSSRKTDFSECARKSLEQRYASPDRLQNLIPFEQLLPIKESILYTGGISFYLALKDLNNNYFFKMLGSVCSNRKIQHAVLVDEKTIIVVYVASIELWKLHKSITKYNNLNKTDCYLYKTYSHPHFAGLHTVSMVTEKLAVISASASDAIMILDLDSGEVKKNIRMPKEIYGENYEITEEMDLRNHYIKNDLQIAHINSAYPDKKKNNIVVSALIPGAVGCFNLDTGKYVELISGHVGCHGARVSDKDLIYFTDSTEGKLLVIDKNRNVKNMFSIESKWLHDSIQIDGDIYAFSIADKNELRIVDIKSNKIHYKKKFITFPNKLTKHDSFLKKYIKSIPFFYGNSTQFLDMYRLT